MESVENNTHGLGIFASGLESATQRRYSVQPRRDIRSSEADQYWKDERKPRKNLRQWIGISGAETIFSLAEVGDLCEEFKDDSDRPRRLVAFGIQRRRSKE